jgi:GNAT superfamily N-acetyltransferase
MVVRAATRADLKALLALYRHLNPEDPPPPAAAAEAAWETMSASGGRILLAEVMGMPVSTCTLSVIANLTRGARPYGVIENVVTHPEHRRKGLGHAVLRAAMESAWSTGCYKVMLATGSRHEETLRFYERAGFMRGGKTFFEARR